MPTPISGPISLDRALSGENATFAPKDGVYQLARSGLADAQARLVALAREEGPLDIRRRATFALSTMADARSVLLRLVDVGEPAVLAAVLLALARVGKAEDVKVIRRAAGRLSGHEAEQAQFSELLLAHRVGLGPEVVPPIAIQPERQKPSDARALSAGSPEEARQACDRFVAQAHLGFEPDVQRSALIHCVHNDILFIPATDLHGGKGERVLATRMIAGSTASYEREAGVWRQDLWVFSAPRSAGIELQVWTVGGRACYTGHARVDGEDVTFELVTGAGSSLAIAHVRGRITEDSVVIDGVVGDRPATDARQPTPLQPPADIPGR